jgi:hypothetical protein
LAQTGVAVEKVHFRMKRTKIKGYGNVQKIEIVVSGAS